MTKDIEYKGRVVTLHIHTSIHDSVLQGMYRVTSIKLESPNLRGISEAAMDPVDMGLIEEIYTEWFKRCIDNE